MEPLWNSRNLLPENQRREIFRRYESHHFPYQVRRYFAQQIEAYLLERNLSLDLEGCIRSFTSELPRIVRQRAEELGDSEGGATLSKAAEVLNSWDANRMYVFIKEYVDDDFRLMIEYTKGFENEVRRINWMIRSIYFLQIRLEQDGKVLEALLKDDLPKDLSMQLAGRRSGSVICMDMGKIKSEVEDKPANGSMRDGIDSAVCRIILLFKRLCRALREAYDTIYNTYLKKMKLGTLGECLQEDTARLSSWTKIILGIVNWGMVYFLRIGEINSQVLGEETKQQLLPAVASIPGLIRQLRDLRKDLLENVMVVSAKVPNLIKRLNKITATVSLLASPAEDCSSISVEAIIINEYQAMGLIAQTQDESTSGGLLQLTKDPYNKTIENGCAKLRANVMQFQLDPLKQDVVARFRDLSVINLTREYVKIRKRVMQEKFCFLFRSRCIVNGEAIVNWCCSAPFTCIVHLSQRIEGEATIFWDESFKEEIRRPFQVVEHVPMDILLKALNRFFNKFTATSRKFSIENMEYLRNRISTELNLESRSELVSMNAFCKSYLRPKSDPMTFWDWFFSAAELVRDRLRGHWKDGHIIGFIDLLETKKILGRQEPGTLLLRFPEIEVGTIHPSIHEPNGRIVHWLPKKKYSPASFPLPIRMMAIMNNGHATRICHYNFSGDLQVTRIQDAFGSKAQQLQADSTGGSLVPGYHRGDPTIIRFQDDI